MDFIKSETYINLAKSFAGECQAGMRYQLIAKTAFSQGYKILADEIRHIAKNETNHAKTFFDKIIELAGPQDNIDICAGYPFNSGTIEEGLMFSMQDEESESKSIYPSYRDTALKEGYKDIARIFDMTANVEAIHKKKFEFLYNAFKDGNLYKSTTPQTWTCSNCGYEHVAREAFHICPLCQVSQGFVEINFPKEIKI